MFLRLDWCDPGVWSFTQPLLALPAVVNFDSHVVDIRQNKSYLLMPVENNALQLMQAWTATAAV